MPTLLLFPQTVSKLDGEYQSYPAQRAVGLRVTSAGNVDLLKQAMGLVRPDKPEDTRGIRSRMKSIVQFIKKAVYVLLALAAGLGILQWTASERVEVVELIAADAAGVLTTTRLWVADDAGMAYLRVGADGSGWYDVCAIRARHCPRYGASTLWRLEKLHPGLHCSD